jgi:cytochrome c oxidase subunit II
VTDPDTDLLRRMLFLPERASTFADQVDPLHYSLILAALVVSTAIGVTSLAFFVRYRRRRPDQQTPKVTQPLWLEALFIVVPAGCFLAWFTIGYRDFIWLSTPPKDAIDIYVLGKQWMWQFSYPDGPSAVDVLRVPAGRPVRLLLTSRDVIHSFFVPEFRIKQDAIPNRYTQTWFEATRVGRYQVLCAEYCGTDHSMMRGEVVVMEPAEYDGWVLQQSKGLVALADAERTTVERESAGSSLIEQGRRLAVANGCVRCHSQDGTPHIGPTWLDLYRRTEKLQSGESVIADEAYLTESMMDPAARVVAGFNPVMPPFHGKLQGPEVAALIELIKSLRSERLGREPAGGPAYEPIRP